MECFALLDDCQASESLATSRLYTGLVRTHRCDAASDLPAVWQKIRADLADGLHCVVLGEYEFGLKLLGIGSQFGPSRSSGELRFLIFRQLELLGVKQVDRILVEMDGAEAPTPGGVAELRASVDRPTYRASIERVRELIRAGETYQINYTYRIRGSAFGTPVGLYRRLRARQPVQFGALISLPPPSDDGAPADDCEWVLSCSPELFVRNDGGLLTTRPMKGTAPRDSDPANDERNAKWLAADEKNRAENLMIVDLLRNDIGRVSSIGTVRVPRLFDIESYRTIHQMTSTVQGRLREDVDFVEVLRALFPCGSITGAPKHHTMELISELEMGPRNLYTGAIGWIDAPSSPAIRSPDFCMSVAIRTLLLGRQDDSGIRSVEFGVGGGIVLDSLPESEYDETLTKARFVTGLDPGFKLIETMRANKASGIRNLHAHLGRLTRSARAHRFHLDVASVEAELGQAVASAAERGPLRLRLELSHDGSTQISIAKLAALNFPVTFLVAEHPLPIAERTLRGDKTTLRATYDASIKMAESVGAFDTVFFNQRGHLTEGARTNVFLYLDGEWVTPGLECGLLAGTYRERLLRRPGWVKQASLSRSDLLRATRVVLCNALRGPIAARPHAS